MVGRTADFVPFRSGAGSFVSKTSGPAAEKTSKQFTDREIQPHGERARRRPAGPRRTTNDRDGITAVTGCHGTVTAPSGVLHMTVTDGNITGPSQDVGPPPTATATAIAAAAATFVKAARLLLPTQRSRRCRLGLG